MQFRRDERQPARPAFSCCSVSLSISFCSLPVFAGLLVAGLLARLALRYAGKTRRTQGSSMG